MILAVYKYTCIDILTSTGMNVCIGIHYNCAYLYVICQCILVLGLLGQLVARKYCDCAKLGRFGLVVDRWVYSAVGLKPMFILL